LDGFEMNAAPAGSSCACSSASWRLRIMSKRKSLNKARRAFFAYCTAVRKLLILSPFLKANQRAPQSLFEGC
jgi:hypothetical protein